MDVSPRRRRDFGNYGQGFRILVCLVPGKQPRQDSGVVIDDGVRDQPRTLVADLDFDIGQSLMQRLEKINLVAFSSSHKDRALSGRLRDLHQEQLRVHSQLRRSMAAGRKDQYGVRRIDDQSGCAQEVREKTTNAVDATRTSFAAPGEDHGPQQ